MIIENTHVVKIDTPIGPRYCVLIQTISNGPTYLKNGKKIPSLSLEYDKNFNPWGFGTLEEIKSYYNESRYNKEVIPNAFASGFYTKKNTFWGTKTKPLSFFTLCKYVTENLENPVMLSDLFEGSFDLDMILKKDRNCQPFETPFEPFYNISMEKAVEEWFKRKDDKCSIYSITFRGVHLTKNQRKQIEKGYYLINIFDFNGKDVKTYITGRRKGCFTASKYMQLAQQFNTEAEAIAYTSKYKRQFGTTGYCIEEFPGMKYEDGLSA